MSICTRYMCKGMNNNMSEGMGERFLTNRLKRSGYNSDDENVGMYHNMSEELGERFLMCSFGDGGIIHLTHY